jgi:hypothetical protein
MLQPLRDRTAARGARSLSFNHRLSQKAALKLLAAENLDCQGRFLHALFMTSGGHNDLLQSTAPRRLLRSRGDGRGPATKRAQAGLTGSQYPALNIHLSK